MSDRVIIVQYGDTAYVYAEDQRDQAATVHAVADAAGAESIIGTMPADNLPTLIETLTSMGLTTADMRPHPDAAEPTTTS